MVLTESILEISQLNSSHKTQNSLKSAKKLSEPRQQFEMRADGRIVA